MAVFTGDPIADLILEGRAASVDEAERIYLDEHLLDIVDLVRAPMSDDAFRAHPLVALLLRRSRPWEDTLA